jgi:hypothetical protein
MTSKGGTIDIGMWLRGLGLGQYESTFRENETTNTVLLNLTVEDLKDLGVGIVRHRRRLLDAIAAISPANRLLYEDDVALGGGIGLRETCHDGRRDEIDLSWSRGILRVLARHRLHPRSCDHRLHSVYAGLGEGHRRRGSQR